MKIIFNFLVLFLMISCVHRQSKELINYHIQPRNKPLGKDVNVKSMRVSHYGAASKPLNDNWYGHATSNNLSKVLKPNEFLKKTVVALEVRTDSITILNQDWNAYDVYLYNTTSKRVFFSARDGSLDIVMQAQDAKGIWHDIESLARSWCGNSYHQLYLKPNEYWILKVPRYSGTLQTQFRLKGSYLNARNWKEITFYSNVFDGSVNPEQFSQPKKNGSFDN